MYSQTDLTNEVNDYLNSLDDNTQAVPSWITQDIVKNHSDLFGSDKDFALLCVYGHVRRTVTSAMGRYKLKPEEPNPLQMELDLKPGYKRLQKRYLVDRDGEQVGVPVEMLTDEEINQKLGELESMAQGCFEHADELRRYRDARKYHSAA
jgi:hypothetical protein